MTRANKQESKPRMCTHTISLIQWITSMRTVITPKGLKWSAHQMHFLICSLCMIHPFRGANLRGEALSCDQPSTSSVSSSFLAVLSGVLTPYLPLLKQGVLGLPSEGDSHQNCWNLFSIAQVSTPLKPAKTGFGQGQTAVIVHPKKYGWGPQFAQHQDLPGIHLI